MKKQTRTHKFKALVRTLKRGLWDAVAATKDFLGFAGGGGYSVLDPQRQIITGFARRMQQYSANELADLSLPQLRALCRQLERDNATARAAVEGAVAQVVGTGIALWPDTGDEKTDDLIGHAFNEWIEACDPTGKRSLYDLQSEAFREWFLVGEHVWRVIVDPDRIDIGLNPAFILPLESEWIANAEIGTDTNTGLTKVNGIALNEYGVPQYYFFVSPEHAADKEPDIVAANEVIHGFEFRRSVQNRGEPWLAPVVERIHQEGDLIDTELKAAINASGIAVVVTSEYQGSPDNGSDPNQLTNGTAEDPAVGIGVGSVARLYPGEDAKAFSHDRPGQQIAPFTEMLRGSIAGACRVSRRWLDRNYSTANFSSQRADEQDSRRLLAPIIEQFGKATIGAAYLAVLPYLCAKLGIAVPKRKLYKLLPDGQPYVNPRDDINAASMSIAAGLSTHEEEISKRGGDYRKVWAQLAKEREEAKTLGLTLDLSSTNAPALDSTVNPVPKIDDE